MAFTALEIVAIVAFSAVGLGVLRALFRTFYEIFVSPIVNKVDFRKQGKWALITGSTDGLGKAYARALAKIGCDIILVSRTETKLKQVAEDIEAEFKVKTKIIVADFVEMKAAYDTIEKEIEGMEIGTLVNNVGISYPYPDYFLEMKNGHELHDSILKANVETVVRMCQMVMPGMVERQRGVVINVSSASALMPGLMLNVYSASKMFVNKFTENLSQEYSRHGIIVQCIYPGYVATKMSKMRQSFMAPSPDTYVESALRLVGSKTHTCGYLPHSLALALLNLIAFISPDFAVWIVNRSLENVKRRSQKKLAK